MTTSARSAAIGVHVRHTIPSMVGLRGAPHKPTVIGWWARATTRATTCATPSLAKSFWNSVLPRHAKYCRPWSVNSSFGLPKRAHASRDTSTAMSPRWCVKSPCPTTYLLKSSRNAIK